MTDTALVNSLRTLTRVFSGIDDYRVVGSTLVAAINGKPHRELHDIDLVIDEDVYEEVRKRFKQEGFKIVKKHAPGFEWDEFVKKDYLTFGILLVGRFDKDYFEYIANRWLKLRIKNAYLSRTDYKLMGHAFQGIPIKSVYEGIKIASLNNKRKIDRDIVEKKYDEKQLVGPTLNQAFKVNVFGFNIPYLYALYSHLYNLVGGLRLRMGKSYDPWN